MIWGIVHEEGGGGDWGRGGGGGETRRGVVQTWMIENLMGEKQEDEEGMHVTRGTRGETTGKEGVTMQGEEGRRGRRRGKVKGAGQERGTRNGE